MLCERVHFITRNIILFLSACFVVIQPVRVTLKGWGIFCVCVCVCVWQARVSMAFSGGFENAQRTGSSSRGQGPIRAGGKVPGTIAYRRSLASYVEDTQGLSMV